MSIIIVGSGITGATLAIAVSHLTNGKLPVHLIEAVPLQDANHPGFDTRSIALARGSCQFLSRIGVYQEITDCITPIKMIHVSDHKSVGSVTFDAQDYHVDTLGQVVELHKIRLKLFHLLKKNPGIILHCPARIIRINRSKLETNVILDNKISLKAKLLVAADGSCSDFASKCGIKWRKKRYEQFAVVTNVSTSISHKEQAWEYFTNHGSLAMLPISGGRSSLTWCHPIKKQEEVLSWSDKYFCNELQKVFGWKLGRIEHVSQRIFYPLMLITAQQYISHRMVLVGNAAQTLHPIAGQGFNLALRDIIILAKILAEAWSWKEDFGDNSILRYYRNRRKADKFMTIRATDGLVALFANHWIPFVIIRNAGLIAMERLVPVKNIIANRMLNMIDH